MDTEVSRTARLDEAFPSILVAREEANPSLQRRELGGRIWRLRGIGSFAELGTNFVPDGSTGLTLTGASLRVFWRGMS